MLLQECSGIRKKKKKRYCKEEARAGLEQMFFKQFIGENLAIKQRLRLCSCWQTLEIIQKI